MWGGRVWAFGIGSLELTATYNFYNFYIVNEFLMERSCKKILDGMLVCLRITVPQGPYFNAEAPLESA